jgi:hypothetical protein
VYAMVRYSPERINAPRAGRLTTGAHSIQQGRMGTRSLGKILFIYDKL